MRTVLLFLFGLLVACGPVTSAENTPEATAAPATTARSASSAVTVNLEAIPAVDITQHSVPLTDIVFDTFRRTNRAVPLPDAEPALIRSLRDAIPPIYYPQFEPPAAAAGWLKDDDIVLGYAQGDEAFAYPVRILNFHEIVSHEVNGRPIMATYCPLCRSGVVYDRLLNGEEHLFGNTSALYESDMVMLDHQTGSYWVQVSGEAVVGPLTGERLTPLPSQMTTWGQWLTQYPETLTLSRDTGYPRNYDRDPFVDYADQLSASGRFAFPVTDAVRDPRLDPGDIVLAVQVGEQTSVYPLSRLGEAVINDVIAGTTVVIFSSAAGPTGAAYAPFAAGQSLTFRLSDEGKIVDAETGSSWSFSGRSTAGPLADWQLEALPVRSSLWFAIIAGYPDLTLYETDGS